MPDAESEPGFWGHVDEVEGKRKAPVDRWDVDLPTPVIGMGAAIPAMPPPPPLTEDPFVCTLGPCRHYWQIATPMGAGHAPGTFGPGGLTDPETGLELPEPRQTTRTCLVHPGTETELSGDDPVLDCNRWHPLDDADVIVRNNLTKRLAELRSQARKGA